jgi:hypothetical protein
MYAGKCQKCIIHRKCIFSFLISMLFVQCVNVSPSSFMMVDSGRARTFDQRSSPDVEQAIASCPVDCMHPVTYRELEEFESARDQGDGRSDHKYLGQQHTPLHVAGMDSDNNRRSSWYHTLKHRCLGTSKIYASYGLSIVSLLFCWSHLFCFQSHLSVHRKGVTIVQSTRIQGTIHSLKRILKEQIMLGQCIS